MSAELGERDRKAASVIEARATSIHLYTAEKVELPARELLAAVGPNSSPEVAGDVVEIRTGLVSNRDKHLRIGRHDCIVHVIRMVQNLEDFGACQRVHGDRFVIIATEVGNRLADLSRR